MDLRKNWYYNRHQYANRDPFLIILYPTKYLAIRTTVHHLTWPEKIPILEILSLNSPDHVPHLITLLYVAWKTKPSNYIGRSRTEK